MINKYNTLRIASINGQGSEGCGVQACTAQLQYWAKKVGAIVDFYSFDEKKYSRGNAHDMNIISFKSKDIVSICQKLNDNYDIVMFMSYPHNKYDEKDCKLFYYNLYEKVVIPLKAVFIHEIHILNIDKITYLVPMIVNADIVFHFDIDTWFSKTVDKLGFKKIKDRIFKYTLWTNFDELDKIRQIHLNNKKDGVVSMTRWSSLKNVDRSVILMDKLLKKEPSFSCSIHGIERSIGAKFQILDMPQITYVNNGSLKENGEGPVKVYGPINRSIGLDIVGSHKFATSFYSLPKAPQNYGARMEYTQIEIIGVGTIPIFDKHWATHNSVSDGRKYIDIPYSAIYTDGNNLDEIADKIIELSKDSAEMQKYIDASYKMVKDEFDADFVIPRTIELIKSVGKNPVTLSVREICEKFVNKEFADEIIKLEDEGKLPVLGIGEFENQEVHYLSNCKQVLVKKCMSKADKYKFNQEKKAENTLKDMQKSMLANKIKSLF